MLKTKPRFFLQLKCNLIIRQHKHTRCSSRHCFTFNSHSQSGFNRIKRSKEEGENRLESQASPTVFVWIVVVVDPLFQNSLHIMKDFSTSSRDAFVFFSSCCHILVLCSCASHQFFAG